MRPPLLAVVLGCLLAACSASGSEPADDAAIGLAPTFPPASTAMTAAVAATPPTDTASPASAPTTAPTTGASETTGPAAPPAPSAGVVDPAGDVTPGASVDAPPWADLLGARLTRLPEEFELRVTLAGGSAPASSGSAAQTMNVASFYDLDGDGLVDVEVWANLADGGWGGSWFDSDGVARYGDDAGVAITVDGADVVLRFPATHLDSSAAFRWSVASEHGTYAAIGTALAARDDVPDGDAPVQFPG